MDIKRPGDLDWICKSILTKILSVCQSDSSSTRPPMDFDGKNNKDESVGMRISAWNPSSRAMHSLLNNA